MPQWWQLRGVRHTPTCFLGVTQHNEMCLWQHALCALCISLAVPEWQHAACMHVCVVAVVAGDNHDDLALCELRGEQARGHLGVWGAFAMCNHRCAPNSINHGVGDSMIVRAARQVRLGHRLRPGWGSG